MNNLAPIHQLTLSPFEVEHLVALYRKWILDVEGYWQKGECTGSQEREEFYYANARIRDFLNAGAITTEKCIEIAEGVRKMIEAG